jgi:hypothetical protein
MVTSHNILPDQQAQDSGQMSLFGDMRHEMMVSNQWANYLLGSAEANTSSRLTFIRRVLRNTTHYVFWRGVIGNMTRTDKNKQ